MLQMNGEHDVHRQRFLDTEAASATNGVLAERRRVARHAEFQQKRREQVAAEAEAAAYAAEVRHVKKCERAKNAALAMENQFLAEERAMAFYWQQQLVTAWN